VKTTVNVEVPIQRSSRVLQVESIFDVPPKEHETRTWEVDLPIEEQDWSIGLIVGPSGCGQSSSARAMFGEAMIEPFEWSSTRALVDEFPEHLGIREVTGLLSAVGLGSVPAWMRPYHVLSTGEQFRATVAHTMASVDDLAVIDEWTSTVDRQVAQVASATASKLVRRSGKRLVAVTCHYDVEEWLQPDWVYQPHLGEFTWRSVQPRPRVSLDVYQVDRKSWSAFSHHHYLSSSLLSSAKCFGGYVNGQCIAFTSYRHLPHAKTNNIKMGHRLVVLPDWQGLGIGLALDDWLGEHLAAQGYRYRNAVAHPAMIRAYSKSPRWRLVRQTSRVGTSMKARKRTSLDSLTKSHMDPRRMNLIVFEYMPVALDAAV
jgi:GNAT superfamily N-acetyltransferase